MRRSIVPGLDARSRSGPGKNSEIDAPAAPRQRLARWMPGVAAIAVLGAVALALATRFAAREPDLELALGGRVAVLPLVNATGDRADDWVATGLAEMISETLARSPGVEVVGSERLRQTLESRGLEAGDPADRERGRELARALGAELVLDATLRRQGGGALGAGEEPYRLYFRLFAGGGEAAGGELRGADPLAVADRLASQIARAIAADAAPAAMARVFSRSPFADRLYGMGLHQLRTAGAAAAAPHFEIALGSRPRFLQARARLSECRRELGDADASRRLALAVLDEAQARGDRRYQVWSFRALGRLAALEGRFDEAQENESRAFSLVLERGDPALRGEILFELARLALARVETARAEELFIEILELRQNLGDRLGEVDVLLEIGSLFLGGGDLEGASQVLDRARQLAAGLDDLWTEMRAVVSLGEVARRRGEDGAAGELWSRALAFYDQRGDHARQLLLARNLAEVRLRSRDFKSAEELLHRVIDLAAERQDPAFEAWASLRLTWVLLRTGYPRQARSHLDRALALDRWLADDRLELQQVIAWFAYEQGNYRLAVDTQREAKRQAAERWSSSEEDFLGAFEQALQSGRRWPLPGEEGYRPVNPG